jgi:PKD repeat protein
MQIGEGARNTMTRRGGRTLRRSPRWAAIGLGLILAQPGCNLHSVDVPSIEGPSEEGFSLQLQLSKDVLVADGGDSAVVTATVRGPDGRPAANKDVFFAVADATGTFADIGVIVGSNGPGTGATVRTNGQGVAQVLYEAPSRTDATANQTVLIMVRIVGNNANGKPYHSVRIELRSAEPRLFPPNGANKAPTCQFITEPAAGPFKVNQVIGFHSTSFDTDGVIIRYEWTFGDGTSDEGSPDQAHVYRAAGTYAVTHIVTDDNGAQAKCAALNIVVQ